MAVFGAEAVGLAAVMAARIVGAGPIIGVDIISGRLELALQLGATHIIDARYEDVAAGIAISSASSDWWKVAFSTGSPASLRSTK